MSRAFEDLEAAVDAVLEAPLWSLPDTDLSSETQRVFVVMQRLSARFTGLIAQAADRGIPRQAGAANATAWLTGSLAMAVPQAHWWVKLAGLLRVTPSVAEALAAGEVSTDQAFVIAQTIKDLPPDIGDACKQDAAERLTKLAIAERLAPEVLARHRQEILEQVDPERAEEQLARDLERRERSAHDRRTLTLSPFGEGEYRLRAILSAEAAAVVRAALDPLCAPSHREPSTDTATGAAAAPSAAAAASATGTTGAAGAGFAPGATPGGGVFGASGAAGAGLTPGAMPGGGAFGVSGAAGAGLAPGATPGGGAFGVSGAAGAGWAAGTTPGRPFGLGGAGSTGRAATPGGEAFDTAGAVGGSADAAGSTQEAAVGDKRSAGARRADALVEICRRALDAGELPENGGEKPHLVITMSWEQLRDQVGAGLLDTGDLLTPETVRRLACDAQIIPAVLNGEGQVLDLGRARRLIDGPLRRALVLRDKGCAWPGCDRPARWCHGHHITPWSEGGRTSLDSSVLLCGFHHVEVHKGWWQVRIAADGHPEFIPPAYIDPLRRPQRNTIHRR